MRNKPRENLVRVMDLRPVALRSAANGAGDGKTLTGHFAVFNQWTEIDSVWEGRFMERIAPGAFQQAFQDRGKIKVLYDHGRDPQLGNKPLGSIEVLREDRTGAYYEVSLLDTSYNRDFVIPAAERDLLGASFRFSVNDESWNQMPERSDYNPNGYPERTISGMNVFEFGPVTFPAYEGASAGIRSGTDEFYGSLEKDPHFVARFTERVGLGVVERVLEMLDEKGKSHRDTSAAAPTSSKSPASGTFVKGDKVSYKDDEDNTQATGEVINVYTNTTAYEVAEDGESNDTELYLGTQLLKVGAGADLAKGDSVSFTDDEDDTMATGKITDVYTNVTVYEVNEDGEEDDVDLFLGSSLTKVKNGGTYSKELPGGSPEAPSTASTADKRSADGHESLSKSIRLKMARRNYVTSNGVGRFGK